MSHRTAPPGASPPEIPHSAARPEPTRLAISDTFPRWLDTNGVSVLFSTYQTGRVGSIGLAPDGSLALHEQNFARALGLAATDQTLWVASMSVIWRLGNALAPGERDNDHYDRLYQPRLAYITGDLDTHEIAVGADGRPVFVSTKYSCLATLSDTHNFQPLWKPRFVSKLLPEDRCHLNGLAMENGAPRYVTAVGRTDMVEGWRTKRSGGGVLIDVTTDAIVCEDISIPHSPRVKNGKIWLLESGRGQLITVDAASGKKEDVVFCPGFLRGLALYGDYALVTTSRPRDGMFEGLPLDDELKARGQTAQCAIHVIDLTKRAIVETLAFEGGTTELFDVAVLPGVRCPLVEGPTTPQLGSRHVIAPFRAS